MTDPIRTVTAKLPRSGAELVFGIPSDKDWTRYFHKLMTLDNDLSARKELLQVTCQSHELEELKGLLKYNAAAIQPISLEIESIAGGDVSPELVPDADVVRCQMPDGLTVEFALPDLDQYEAMQDASNGKDARSHEVLSEFLKDLDKHGGAPASLVKYPASVVVISHALNDAIGGDVEIVVKKE